MLGRTVKIEVPRRAVVGQLLFSLASVAWLYVSFLFVYASILNYRDEKDLISYLSGATQTAVLEYLEDGEEGLQAIVSRYQREGSLFYCAIVSEDDRILAHNQRGRVGEQYTPPDGTPVYLGQSRGIRFPGPAGKFVRAYHQPLEARGETFGHLHMAAEEADVWEAARSATPYAPLTLFGPVVCMVLSALVLHRTIRPLAAVESQLRSAALAPTLEDVELLPVPATTAGAVGWNRIADRFEQQESGALEERLSSAVQALRQEKSDDVLNSMAEGVSVTDRDGRITFANQAMAALFSETGEAESLHSQIMEQVLSLDDDEDVGSPLVRAELRGRHVVEEVKRGPDDAPQFLRVARSPIRTADRSAAGHVWSVRDVTQQKMAEETRNQFLDSATHELRTPLANIKAYAETLSMSEMLDVESQKEFCNTINSEATRLARFIDDLLSISSMEVGSLALNRQGVELERLFAEVIRKVKPQMDQKELSFNAIFPDKYPQMKIDKDKITVALINLLGNAAKYTPDQGQVALKVKQTDTELVVEVEDSGVGISEEELPKIFDKFFRSANPAVQQETGTGLGLSMAHEVIRLHGGDLTVQSELGEGSTFVVTLPLK